jgi:hypothetical protein
MNFMVFPIRESENTAGNKAKSLFPWSLLSKWVKTEDKQINEYPWVVGMASALKKKK